jgi:hypothetical protein
LSPQGSNGGKQRRRAFGLSFFVYIKSETEISNGIRLIITNAYKAGLAQIGTSQRLDRLPESRALVDQIIARAKFFVTNATLSHQAQVESSVAEELQKKGAPRGAPVKGAGEAPGGESYMSYRL